jgi:oligo-1,6-glucosidase
MSKDEFLTAVRKKGRDNARTPMQWDGSLNAGFTTGTPWLKVNSRYSEINVAKALQEPDSIFYYYQSLIKLRHSYDVFTDGRYELLMPDHPHLYVYTRENESEKLLVAANLSENTVSFDQPDDNWKLLLGNYEDTGTSTLFRPYEAAIYYLEK